MTDEKTVEVELLDDATKIDGVRYRKGDKIVVAESTFENWQRFGSARKWGQKGKDSGDTKEKRSLEGAQAKQAEATAAAAEHEQPEQASTPVAPAAQSGKPGNQRR